MWGYPLWLFIGLWLVLVAPAALEAERLTKIGAAWGTVFEIFIVIFAANYSVLPYIDE